MPNLRTVGEIMKEGYKQPHLLSKTEQSTVHGEYDNDKNTLETKVEELEKQIKKLQENQNNFFHCSLM